MHSYTLEPATDSNEWKYIAELCKPNSFEDAFGSSLYNSGGRSSDFLVSDAVLLYFLAPIESIPIEVDGSTSVVVCIRQHVSDSFAAHGEESSYNQNCGNCALLGKEFSTLQLRTSDQFFNGTRAVLADSSWSSRDTELPAQHRKDWLFGEHSLHTFEPHVEVEHTVTVWGYSERNILNCGSWARVVRKHDELYVINLYSDEPLFGGPVLDGENKIVGIISTHSYKGGKQSAYYMASLKGLAW